MLDLKIHSFRGSRAASQTRGSLIRRTREHEFVECTGDRPEATVNGCILAGMYSQRNGSLESLPRLKGVDSLLSDLKVNHTLCDLFDYNGSCALHCISPIRGVGRF
jgi:hypothetical protein